MTNLGEEWKRLCGNKEVEAPESVTISFFNSQFIKFFSQNRILNTYYFNRFSDELMYTKT
jgi:hypothetical protein